MYRLCEQLILIGSFFGLVQHFAVRETIAEHVTYFSSDASKLDLRMRMALAMYSCPP
jgi:hypothetical protein